jgi:hypothetical protein
MGKIDERIFLRDFRVRIMHGETGAEDSHDVHMSRAQLMRHDGRPRTTKQWRPNQVGVNVNRRSHREAKLPA